MISFEYTGFKVTNLLTVKQIFSVFRLMGLKKTKRVKTDALLAFDFSQN